MNAGGAPGTCSRPPAGGGRAGRMGLTPPCGAAGPPSRVRTAGLSTARGGPPAGLGTAARAVACAPDRGAARDRTVGLPNSPPTTKAPSAITARQPAQSQPSLHRPQHPGDDNTDDQPHRRGQERRRPELPPIDTSSCLLHPNPEPAARTGRHRNTPTSGLTRPGALAVHAPWAAPHRMRTSPGE